MELGMIGLGRMGANMTERAVSAKARKGDGFKAMRRSRMNYVRYLRS